MRLVVAFAVVFGCSACADQSQPNQTAEAEQNPASEAQDLPASEPINVQLSECKYAPDASIYNRAASQWRAEQFGDNPISLTVWRHKDGGATQFSFYTTQRGNTYRIDTVDGSTKVGEGTVQIGNEGDATTFEIRGKDESGNQVNATIKCDKLVPLIAEGG